MAFNAGVHRCQFMYIHVNRCKWLIRIIHFVLCLYHIIIHFVICLYHIIIHFVLYRQPAKGTLSSCWLSIWLLIARVASTEYLLAKFFFFGSFFFLWLICLISDIRHQTLLSHVLYQQDFLIVQL